MYSLRLKRVYSSPERSDGQRILVDRLWPRGLKRETACVDQWNKAAAPSPELRTWFHHDPERFDLFRAAYLSELDKNPASRQLAEDCNARLRDGNVTLLYAAKDTTHNHAVILLEWLIEELKEL